jgi:hypothetical protein
MLRNIWRAFCERLSQEDAALKSPTESAGDFEGAFETAPCTCPAGFSSRSSIRIAESVYEVAFLTAPLIGREVVSCFADGEVVAAEMAVNAKKITDKKNIIFLHRLINGTSLFL